MKFINIFLGSSVDEKKGLMSDRDALAKFVLGLNNRFSRKGIYINLELCENSDNAMLIGGSQQRYDDFIKNEAEAAVFLFYRHAGKYTMHELEVARDKLRATGNVPYISVFFKADTDGSEQTESIKNAHSVIEEGYGHYCRPYTHIDTVKIDILFYIGRALEGAQIEVEESNISLLGESVEDISLANVYAFRNSVDWNGLKEQLDKLDREIKSLIPPQTAADRIRLNELTSQRQKSYDSLKALEGDMLTMLKTLSLEAGSLNADKNRLNIYRLIEAGDYKNAKKLYTLEQAEAEADANDLRREMIKHEAQDKIATIRAEISAYLLDLNDPERFVAIKKYYEIALRWSQEADDWKIVYDYAKFLYRQNECAYAIKIMEKLLADCNGGKLTADEEALSYIYNLTGSLLESADCHEQALLYDLKGVEILERLIKSNPQAHEPLLAAFYGNIGVIYTNTKDYKQAELYTFRALKIRERLCREAKRGLVFAYMQGKEDSYFQKEKPNFPEIDLANSYHNLASICERTNRYLQAEEHYLKAIEIVEKWRVTAPRICEPLLGTIHCHLAALYCNLNRYEQSKKYYLKAIEIAERLCKENPQAYEPKLAKCYNYFAILLEKVNDYEQAEVYHLKSLEIFKKLNEVDPQAFEFSLAVCCYNLAVIYGQTNRYEQSEKYCIKAIPILEKLCVKDSQTYEPELAKSYDNLAYICGQTNRYEQSEKYYLKAIEIFKKLNEVDPQAFEFSLAKCCHNFASMYGQTNNYLQAKKYYLKTIAIFEKLCVKDPQAYKPDLAKCCYMLALLYCTRLGRYAQAEKYCLSAIEIWEGLCTENFLAYGLELANSYGVFTLSYYGKGNCGQAEAYQLKAIETLKKLSGEDPQKFEPHLARNYSIMGFISAKQNKSEQAALYNKLAEDIAKKYPDNPECVQIIKSKYPK